VLVFVRHPHLSPSPTRRSSDLYDVGVHASAIHASRVPRPGTRPRYNDALVAGLTPRFRSDQPVSQRSDGNPAISADPEKTDRSRSEEHTSELQSRENLVCRLLL